MLSVEVLYARLQIDVDALLGVRGIGKGVGQLALHRDVHPTEGVYDLDEPIKVGADVIVDGDAQVVLDSRFDQRWPAAGVIAAPAVGGVDLAKAVSGYPGVKVAGDGEEADVGSFRVDADDDDNVG